MVKTIIRSLIPAFSSMSLAESGAVRIGPSALSAATPIAGIIERFNLVETLNLQPASPSLVSVLPDYQLFNFIQQTGGIGSDIMFPVLRGEMTYAAAIQRGLLHEVLSLFRGYEVTDEFEKIEYVPIAEIHCPRVSGCKATYIHDTKGQDKHLLNIKIFGFGGENGISISIGTGYSIPAEGDCRRVLMPVKLKIKQKKSNEGKPLTPSIEVIEVIEESFRVSIIREEHFCGKDYNSINKSGINQASYDIGKASGIHKVSKRIDSGRRSDFGWSLELKEIGAEFKLNNSVEVIREVKYEYELRGGHDYIGFSPLPNSSIFCWTWKKSLTL